MREGPGFALIDEDGVAFYVADTYDEALRAASEVLPDAEVWYEGPPPWEDDRPPAETRMAAVRMAANSEPTPIRKKEEPYRALRLCSIPFVGRDEVMSMSVEQAHEILEPFFATKKLGKDGVTRKKETYATPEAMIRNLLGRNHKIEKPPRAGLPMSFSIGLNLMPSNNWQRTDVAAIIATMESEYGVKRVELPEVWEKRKNPQTGKHEWVNVATFCASATAQCQASCLVFSGQNLNDKWNTVKKVSLSMALANEPLAFLRILVEAIRKWEVECKCQDAVPFVRLNVYSDIPWEMVCPWLFEMFPGVQFYDYTKVADRMPWDDKKKKYPISNYDLTFSYSGAKKNLAEMDREVRLNKRRVAVTFATIGRSKHQFAGREDIPRTPPLPGKKHTAPEWPQIPEVGLPSTFMGLIVIDGDQSDFRPYDPPFDEHTGEYGLDPVVVGLRWKIPNSQKISATTARLFIVPGYLVEDETTGKRTHFVVMELPRYTEMFGRGEVPPWKDISFDR